MYSYDTLYAQDPEIAQAIMGEKDREHSHLELIASENFVSPAVMAAMGSWLTNKYAEGYPGKRYYGGCQYVDVVEDLARDRAKELFQCEYANVQPHAGAQANTAVQLAVLKPGDTMMGMDLNSGGHLSHGSRANISGIIYNIVSYGVEEDGYIDYDHVLRIAKEAKPKLIICGASAYPRVIDFQKFRAIADEVGAVLMADIAHISGLVCAGEHMSPIPYAHVTTSTTHKTLRGPRGGLILSSQQVADFITENYSGAVIIALADLTDGYDATLDYDALAGQTIIIEASPTPHAEILNDVVAGILAEKDIKLDVVEIDNYTQENPDVDAGTAYANYFQHKPYLDDQVSKEGFNVVSVGEVHTEPMGLYGAKQADLSALGK